jgi:hypothetical protein
MIIPTSSIDLSPPDQISIASPLCTFPSTPSSPSHISTQTHLSQSPHLLISESAKRRYWGLETIFHELFTLDMSRESKRIERHLKEIDCTLRNTAYVPICFNCHQASSILFRISSSFVIPTAIIHFLYSSCAFLSIPLGLV